MLMSEEGEKFRKESEDFVNRFSCSAQEILTIFSCFSLYSTYRLQLELSENGAVGLMVTQRGGIR